MTGDELITEFRVTGGMLHKPRKESCGRFTVGETSICGWQLFVVQTSAAQFVAEGQDVDAAKTKLKAALENPDDVADTEHLLGVKSIAMAAFKGLSLHRGSSVAAIATFNQLTQSKKEPQIALGLRRSVARGDSDQSVDHDVRLERCHDRNDGAVSLVTIFAQ